MNTWPTSSPSGELDRLRETIHVLSDPDLMRDLADSEPAVVGIEAVRELLAGRRRRERSIAHRRDVHRPR